MPNPVPSPTVQQAAAPSPAPLLTDLRGLTVLLSRSRASLERDIAAGRLPPALYLHGSRRWGIETIRRWVEAGCPDARTWVAAEATGRRSVRAV